MGQAASGAGRPAAAGAVRRLPTELRTPAAPAAAATPAAPVVSAPAAAPEPTPAPAEPPHPLHVRNDELVQRMATLHSSVERTAMTASGTQLARDMQAFSVRRKEDGRAVVVGQQPFNTLTAEQLGQLFPPDTDDAGAADAPAGRTRAELAATFRLRPETLAELLDNLRGVTVWTDDRGQLHGRPSRAR